MSAPHTARGKSATANLTPAGRTPVIVVQTQGVYSPATSAPHTARGKSATTNLTPVERTLVIVAQVCEFTSLNSFGLAVDLTVKSRRYVSLYA
jgi:hypothetical protein